LMNGPMPVTYWSGLEDAQVRRDGAGG